MRLALACLLAACCPPAAAPPRQLARPTPPPPAAVAPRPWGLDTLTEGDKRAGFTATALYVDGAGAPVGARFLHDKTGFTFDYLKIESAPQGYLWVSSFPTSDKGEPHTQEHLLLGKGDRGRRLGSFEAMALAQSSAFTAQWRTAYHFHTVAGPDVFWPVMANQLGALLHPDYTDEEIRREVRNFGVDKASDGKLKLEEKGTVYNEMVRAYEGPDAILWRTANQLVYGTRHPLSYESGGYPDAIRTMTPHDIRAFHDDAYHLPNMGMIGAFPSTMKLDGVLAQLDAELGKAGDTGGVAHTEKELPAPAGAAAGTLSTVEFPAGDAAGAGPYLFAWPATRMLDDTERTLLGLFLDAFAGDASTPMYQQLIDSKTRVVDLGASGLSTMVSTDEGQPVYLGVNGVKRDKLDAKDLGDVRARVLAELARIAALPAGSPELAQLASRVRSRAVDLRRRLAKFLDTPPGFGTRGTGQGWMDQLDQLNRGPGFKKSLVMADALGAIDTLLAAGGNPWRDRIKGWGLDVAPYGVVAVPSPALRKQLDADRDRRIADELKSIGSLSKFAAAYEAATPTAAAPELPPLVASPPMTLDDLPYTVDGKTFTAHLDTMASARVTLDFDLGAIDPSLYGYLALLPAALTEAGVIEDGTPIAAADVRERLRKEVLALDVSFGHNPRTNRHELAISGAGNSPDETRHALAWMARMLLAPDWRADNLPRLRDLVDQAIAQDRRREQGPEESWVDELRDTWYFQAQPLQLHAGSFLVEEHDLLKLRYELLGGPTSAAATEALHHLRDAADRPRKDLAALSAAMAAGAPPRGALARFLPKADSPAWPILKEAGKDLAMRLADLPDRSLAFDWKELVSDLGSALERGPTATLAGLEKARAQLVKRANVRVVEVGSTAHEQAIAGRARVAARQAPRRRGHASRRHPRRADPRPREAADRERRAPDGGGQRAARGVRVARAGDVERRVPAPRAGAVVPRRRRRERGGVPRLEPVHRPRRALDVHQDLGRGARVLERPAQLADARHARLLRRARAAAAADAQVRDRAARGGQARREPRALRDRAGVPLARRRRLREPRGADGGGPRRRRHAGEGEGVPRQDPRARGHARPRGQAVRPDARGLRQGAAGLRRARGARAVPGDRPAEAARRVPRLPRAEDARRRVLRAVGARLLAILTGSPRRPSRACSTARSGGRGR